MIVEPTSFYSYGYKLDASFYYPDEGHRDDDNRPVIVACSGFMGLNSIHPARFARALTPLGFTVFGFDYRGFANSEGEKGRVLLEEQISDIANAATFASIKLNKRIILMGWGMGGGLILEAARLVPGVVGLVCMNGFYNGKRVQKLVRGWSGYVNMLKRIEEMRAEAVQSGVVQEVDPFSIYPLDPESDDYVDNVLRRNPDFGGLFKPMLADSLLRFCPEDNLEDLSRVPILIAHGDNNRMHPPTEAESLFQKYPGPKEIVWLWKAGHTEWMGDENPTFKKMMTSFADWFEEHVANMSV